MKTRIFPAFLVFLLAATITNGGIKEKPPLVKVQPVEDVYFGHKITDPYRYLEDLNDPQVRQWMKRHAAYSRSVLNSIPGRHSLIDMMRNFDQRKSERISYLSISENNRYFYLKTTPKDETGKLYFRDGYDGDESLLFDPETLKDDTLKYVITALEPSYDGSKVAFQVAPDGSENATLLIMDVENKTLYPEQIDRCWFGMYSWLPENDAFLFNRLQSADVHDKEREKNSKIYLHNVGTDPALDKEIFSRALYPELGIHPEDIPLLLYDKDSQHLFGFALTVDSRLTVFYAPTDELKKDKINWKPLFTKEDEVYDFITSKSDLYLYTPKNAPRFKLLKTSLLNPDVTNAETVVPENPDAKLSAYALTDKALYYTLSKNGVEETLYRLAAGQVCRPIARGKRL